jgi:hypothetical protein
VCLHPGVDGAGTKARGERLGGDVGGLAQTGASRASISLRSGVP